MHASGGISAHEISSTHASYGIGMAVLAFVFTLAHRCSGGISRFGPVALSLSSQDYRVNRAPRLCGSRTMASRPAAMARSRETC
jgi:hypothetical protein